MSRQSSSHISSNSSVQSRRRSSVSVGGGASECSSSSSSRLTKASDMTQVKPFTLHSDDEEDGDSADNESVSGNSFTTQPATGSGSGGGHRNTNNSSSYSSSLARQSGATRKTGYVCHRLFIFSQAVIFVNKKLPQFGSFWESVSVARICGCYDSKLISNLNTFK